MCGSAGFSGHPMNRAVLVTVTTRADAARSSTGSRCAVNAQWPKWSTPSCCSNPSTVARCGIAITPALFTSRSTRSCPARICWAAVATTDRSPRSSGTTSSDADGYRSRMRVSASPVLAGSRAARTTCAPAPASASAVWKPSPPFAPVTTAVRPVWSGMSLSVQPMRTASHADRHQNALRGTSQVREAPLSAERSERSADLQHGIVGVALGAGPVECRRVRLVLRVLARPTLHQVRVGDDGPAHGDGVGMCGVDELHGLLAGGHPAEAAVGDQRSAETSTQLLHQVAARLRVQHGEVGQAQRTQLVDEVSVGGAHVGLVQLVHALDVVHRREADAHLA